MAGLLISGSAGSGKSAAAREELAASNEPAILAEIQPLYAALLGLERLPNGRYPERLESQSHALRMAEFLRRTILTAGLSRGLKVITSNSDSDLDRRQFLLRELGPGATERIVNVSYDIAVSNLQGPDGTTSDQCMTAVSRWYKNGRRGPVYL